MKSVSSKKPKQSKSPKPPGYMLWGWLPESIRAFQDLVVTVCQIPESKNEAKQRVEKAKLSNLATKLDLAIRITEASNANSLGRLQETLRLIEAENKQDIASRSHAKNSKKK